MMVNQMMKEAFPTIVDVNFTANMETLLDGVEDGIVKWKTVIANFYPDLEEAVQVGSDQRLYLKIPCREDPRMRKIELVLSMFPGDSQAVLYFEDTKKRLGTPCVVHPALVDEMKQLLGADRVVVK